VEEAIDQVRRDDEIAEMASGERVAFAAAQHGDWAIEFCSAYLRLARAWNQRVKSREEILRDLESLRKEVAD
jgi:hypothetical protein